MFYRQMRNTFRRLVEDERGASAIEYALIAALIALAIIVGANLLGGSLNEVFESISDTLQGAISGGGDGN